VHHLQIIPPHDSKKKTKGTEHAIDANAVAKILLTFQKTFPSGVHFLNASGTD